MYLYICIFMLLKIISVLFFFVRNYIIPFVESALIRKNVIWTNGTAFIDESFHLRLAGE